MTPQGKPFGDLDCEYFLVESKDLYAAHNWAEQAGATYVLNMFKAQDRENEFNGAYVGAEAEDMESWSSTELEELVCIKEGQQIEGEL